jgi:hypothetical protein
MGGLMSRLDNHSAQKPTPLTMALRAAGQIASLISAHFGLSGTEVASAQSGRFPSQFRYLFGSLRP